MRDRSNIGESGQRVLITGGGSGIGRAMAEAFADAGARVWVTDRDAGALADLPEGWRGTVCDAADEAGVAALFEEVEAALGGLDTLCANAGTAGPTARIEDVALAEWRACVSVNLEGAFLAARAAAPMMKRQGAGAIVLTSSTAGLFGYPNRAPYAAAKWAVIGLMKTLAMELGPCGIRANAICPGAVEGPRMEGVLAREAAAKGTTRDAIYAGYASGTSMRTWVEARDIAAMAVFLASDAARRVSGQVIAVDGHTENPDPKV
jgi:NAD(P)-dependent dehydrogenase (short-subunit alcohol dehydrogenase family)